MDTIPFIYERCPGDIVRKNLDESVKKTFLVIYGEILSVIRSLARRVFTKLVRGRSVAR